MAPFPAHAQMRYAAAEVNVLHRDPGEFFAPQAVMQAKGEQGAIALGLQVVALGAAGVRVADVGEPLSRRRHFGELVRPRCREVQVRCRCRTRGGSEFPMCGGRCVHFFSRSASGTSPAQFNRDRTC